MPENQNLVQDLIKKIGKPSVKIEDLSDKELQDMKNEIIAFKKRFPQNDDLKTEEEHVDREIERRQKW